ncbi:NinX [Vibrio phage 1.054.O._10N.261.52.A1]|nr:NinX [Vibrio phage 1.054.O._10N.261.52.A1]
MNYEEMSDFEINKLVSGFIDFGNLIVTVNDSEEVVYLCEKDGLWDMLPMGHFSPCSDPLSAWPIISDNEIDIYFNSSSGHGACKHTRNKRGIDVANKNPLRAAMICFLKMKDAENGKH